MKKQKIAWTIAAGGFMISAIAQFVVGRAPLAFSSFALSCVFLVFAIKDKESTKDE